MLTDWCSCFACRGADPRFNIVLVPYDLVARAGIVKGAKSDGVTIKPTDTIFVVNGARAAGCVRIIRRSLARLCGCWIAPEHRGQGMGKALVQHRVAYCEHHTVARVIDTYAFHRRLFLDIGFTERADFKIGTTLLRKVIRGRTQP